MATMATATPTDGNESNGSRGSTGINEKAGPVSETTKRPRAEWGRELRIQAAIRAVFLLTGAALLGLAAYIAGTAGATHIEKVYAAVLAAAVLAILTDILAFILLLLRPKAAPAVCPLDGITIILGAVGIPSIIGSSFQTDLDGVAWKLAIVVIAERVLSIVVCITVCILHRRKHAEEHRPQIFDQKRASTMRSMASSRRASMMTTSTARTSNTARTPNTRSVAHSVIAEESEV